MTHRTRHRAAPAGLTALALGLVLTACVPKPTTPDGIVRGPELVGADGKGGGDLGRLGTDLRLLHEEYLAFVATAASPEATFSPSDPTLLVSDGRVAVDATASDDPVLLERDLTNLGLDRAARFGRVVSGYLPILALPEAAALPSLRQLSAAKAGLR